MKTAIPDVLEASLIRWINDDNLLVGLQTLLTVEAHEHWYVSRAIAISRPTGKVTKLLWDSGGQNAADVIWTPSDGSTRILIGAQYSIYTNYPELFWPTVYSVDVVTGKKDDVVKGREGVMHWQADAQGSVRSGARYNDTLRRYSLLYRSEGSTGSFKWVDEANARKREGLLRPFLFIPGTDHALAVLEDGQGRDGIHEVDMLSQADIRTLYTVPAGSEIGDVVISADRNTLLGVWTTEAAGAVHWFDKSLAQLQTQLDKAVGSRRARIVSFNRDRSRMLIQVDRPDTPGTIYFYDINDGILHKVADLNAVIGSRELSPVRTIRYKARDGLEIEALLTLPKGVEARNLPVVMLPHGGPWAQDTLGYDYWPQFIASRGYAVLQPNFRGSTGYGEDFERKGEGQMGFAMQDDITDGLRWAVAEGIADPARACIVGASYGGYAAMWGIAKDPDQYRCAISVSGVANLRKEVNDFGGNLKSGLFRDDWQRMTPDFAAVSPMNAIDRMKTPLLLIHGKKDVTVDHVQSASLFGRMKDAGKNVELLSLPEADHYFTREPDRVALLRAIETFLARYNPAGSKPAGH